MAAGEEENAFGRISFSFFLKKKSGQREGRTGWYKVHGEMGGCHCCVNSPVSSIPLSILHNSFFWLIKRDSRKIFFLFFILFSIFIFWRKRIFTFGRHSSGEWVSINGLALSLIFVMAIFFFFFTFVRSNAAIQKKGGNKKKKKESRETPIVRVLLWFRRWPNDDDGQPDQVSRASYVLTKEKWKKMEKKRKSFATAGDNRPCTLAIRDGTGCAIVLRPAWRRLPISQQTNRVTATFVCPAQNIIPAVVVETKRKKIIWFFRGGKTKRRKIGGPSVDHANRCRRPFTACVSTPKKIK